MNAVEPDVVVCCREPAGLELAGTVVESLTRRGFRVFFEPHGPGAQPDTRRLQAIDDAPDFVLVLAPGDLDAPADRDDPVRREVAHALRAERHVVVMRAPGAVDPHKTALPPDLAGLSTCQVVAYDPARSRESLSILAHGLSCDVTVDDRRLMRRSRWLFTIAATVLVVGFSLQAVPTFLKWWARPKPPAPLAPLALYWSGFGQRMEAGRWVEFPLEDGGAVSAGDQLRFVFSPSADGFAYVVSRNVRGDVSVLFPNETVPGASRVRAGEVYGVPIGTGWLTVDPGGGLAAVYLVASYDPLQNLEELVEEPEGAMSVGARRELVELTVTGLLDGRRYQLMDSQLRTRSGQTIDKHLTPRPGALKASVRLASGQVVDHPMATQPGLVSAAVELRVAFTRPQ